MGGGAKSPPHERRPIVFPYVVSSTDPESFQVDASTARFQVDWWIEVEWSMQGRTGVLRVDDHGAPFRVSASSAATQTCLWDSEGIPDAAVSAPDCPTARQ
jgi:hypothetical protein